MYFMIYLGFSIARLLWTVLESALCSFPFTLAFCQYLEALLLSYLVYALLLGWLSTQYDDYWNAIVGPDVWDFVDKYSFSYKLLILL